MLHAASEPSGWLLLWQALLQGGTAAMEEQCEERLPSNPISRWRQCGALFGGGLEWRVGCSELKFQIFKLQQRFLLNFGSGCKWGRIVLLFFVCFAVG